MKTEVGRVLSPLVMIAALIWAITCGGQELNIDIVVPEPGTSAVEGKDRAKRNPPQRGENRSGPRRNARPRLDEAPPVLDLDRDAELPAGHGNASGVPTLAPPKNKAVRPWAAADDDSGPDPAWANPAGIPLRQDRNADIAPTPPASEPQPLTEAAGNVQSLKNRGEGSKKAADRNGWLGRRLQSGRREPGLEDSPPLVARRHRTPSQDHRRAPLVPPSPRDHGREFEFDRD